MRAALGFGHVEKSEEITFGVHACGDPDCSHLPDGYHQAAGYCVLDEHESKSYRTSWRRVSRPEAIVETISREFKVKVPLH